MSFVFVGSSLCVGVLLTHDQRVCVDVVTAIATMWHRTLNQP